MAARRDLEAPKADALLSSALVPLEVRCRSTDTDDVAATVGVQVFDNKAKRPTARIVPRILLQLLLLILLLRFEYCATSDDFFVFDSSTLRNCLESACLDHRL